MDSDILVVNNECPECNRSLEAVYRNLVNRARFGDPANRISQKSLTNNGFRHSQVNQYENLMKNQVSFQSSRVEEEEEFEFT